MKNLLTLLTLLCLWQILPAQITPSIYADRNLVSSGGPGPDFYTVCGTGGYTNGLHLWTDSIYTSYQWSTGDTTPRIYIDWQSAPFVPAAVTLTVTDGNGNTGTDSVYIANDSWGTQNWVYVDCETFCANTGALLVAAGNPLLDSVVWSNGFYCDQPFDPYLDCSFTVYDDNNYSFINYNRQTGCIYRGGLTFPLNAISDPDTPLVTVSGNVLTSDPQPNYQWLLNGAPIAGATAQSHTATQNGSYSVQTQAEFADCLGDTTVCGSATSSPVSVTGTALAPGLAAGINLYPNPGSQAQIRSQNLPIQAVSLFNAFGQKFWNRSDLQAFDLQLPTGLPAGSYWIQLETAQGKAVLHWLIP